MPDLKALSSAAARSAKQQGNVAREDIAPAKKHEAATKSKRVRTKTSTSAARQTATVATAPAALPTAVARNDAPVSDEKKTASKAPETKKVSSAEGFKLRISGGDLDLSRSQGITDETRIQLRERFAALDADDQTAQLLALKNTVKQIEKRLNEMQLKMATLPASSAPPVAQPESATPVTPLAPPVVTAPAVQKPAAEIDAAAKPTPPAAKPAAPAKAPTPKTPESSESSIDLTTLIIAGLSALALAALAWWGWNRRTQSFTNSDVADRNDNATTDEFNTWVNDPETTSPGNTTAKQTARTAQTADKERDLNRDERAPEKPDTTRTKNRFAADGATRSAEWVDPVRTAQITGNRLSFERKAEPDFKPATNSSISSNSINPPTVNDIFNLPPDAKTPPVEKIEGLTNNTSSFTLQDTPGDTFDLDLDPGHQSDVAQNTGNQISEDRLRRLRYMHERYPELAARTVSIDEPESVINAARLYYEDNQLGKACELLIYAVEERPQEIRFWLAQFELFRREKMSPQFSDLAQKFQLLFSEAESWPKVRQIGFDLDPANPLYAMDISAFEKFDPASENWLNATLGGDALTQNISEALIADLRASLFAEHRLTHADFGRGPNLLHAMSERG